jgi:hypothetical protein
MKSNFNGTLCASVRLGQSMTDWSMTAQIWSWNLVRPSLGLRFLQVEHVY